MFTHTHTPSMADRGQLSLPSFFQFLPTVRRGELWLLVHFRLPAHAAVPVGGMAVDLLPVWGNDTEVPLMFNWALSLTELCWTQLPSHWGAAFLRLHLLLRKLRVVLIISCHLLTWWRQETSPPKDVIIMVVWDLPAKPSPSATNNSPIINTNTLPKTQFYFHSHCEVVLPKNCAHLFSHLPCMRESVSMQQRGFLPIW